MISSSFGSLTYRYLYSRQELTQRSAVCTYNNQEENCGSLQQNNFAGKQRLIIRLVAGSDLVMQAWYFVIIIKSR